MKGTAYVDTSCLVAIAFDEPGGRAMAARIDALSEVFAANLLEAEYRAALAREGAPEGAALLQRVTWVLPDRPLGPEIGRALEAGTLRGADLWHLATALYLVEQPRDLPFLTLDRRQAAVAERLGFPG